MSTGVVGLVGGAYVATAGALSGVAGAGPVASSAASDELLGKPFALVVALALVSLLPFIFMSVTAFVKISTVLQIVKGAIGAQSVPSGTVVMALAGALTLLAMAPVGEAIFARAAPLLAVAATANAGASGTPPAGGPGFGAPGAAPGTTPLAGSVPWIRGLVEAVSEPLRGFLERNASPKEKLRFFDIAVKARRTGGASPTDVSSTDIVVLVPAFVVTELQEAFALGFVLYLPFLVVDLVVANVLLALGMQMLGPSQISLPLKLLLFVAIDGWGLLGQALVSSYR